jgi:hypothetical protein
MSTCVAGRLVFGLMLVQVVTAPGAVCAQGTFHVRPFVSATEVHESNLFSTASDRQRDFITRFTPGVESDYRSALWTLFGRYTLDVERFANHAELTTMDARQQAAVTIGYRPRPRVSVAGGAEYLTTRTPRELNIATGLTFTRARADRVLTHGSLTRQLDPVTSGTIEYTFTRDRLGRAFDAYTHAASLGASRRLSSRTTVTGRYRTHGFAFTGAVAARSVVMSHSLTTGVTRAMTRSLRVSIDAGPRVTADVVRAEVSASIDWNGERADLSLAYGRTQSTAIGLIGPADIQSLHATLARTLGRSLEVRLGPSVFRSALAGRRADVYVLGAGVTQRFSNAFALDLAFDGAVQYGTLLAGAAAETIPRHALMMRFVAGPGGRPR